MGLNLFGNIYAGKRVLVTGHTGFKGSWLTLWLQTLGAHVAGLALDPDTDPSHWNALTLGMTHDYRIDLRDAAGVRAAVNQYQPDIVFHLAAQPLVRRSYRAPVDTFASNMTGLINLLEAIRECASVRVLINATTDKVYAEQARDTGYAETDPLGGHDPYSTSKACAELISDCYRKSFFNTDATRTHPLALATVRAGNVIGGGDWSEDRLIPDLMRAATSGTPLAIRNPTATRPWQHVLEPLSGYLCLGQNLWQQPEMAGAWNFGPTHTGETSVQSMVEHMHAYWPQLQMTHDSRPHPHEAALLRLNSDKAAALLAWQSVWDLDTTLAKTARWYRAFHESALLNTRDDLATYVADARARHLAWAT